MLKETEFFLIIEDFFTKISCLKPIWFGGMQNMYCLIILCMIGYPFVEPTIEIDDQFQIVVGTSEF